MDLPSTCGGPGMYPAIRHRCRQEVKYPCDQRIDTAEDRRCLPDAESLALGRVFGVAGSGAFGPERRAGITQLAGVVASG
jgi:hypothetical protein